MTAAPRAPPAGDSGATAAARLSALVAAGVHRELLLHRASDPPRLREALAVLRAAAAPEE